MLKISGSLTLEERFEPLMKNFQEARSESEYLKEQLALSIRN